jgi:hypothetical protein
MPTQRINLTFFSVIFLLPGIFVFTPLSPVLATCTCYDSDGNEESIPSDDECASACVELGQTLQDTREGGLCWCSYSTIASIDCSETCSAASLSNKNPTEFDSSTFGGNTSAFITPALNVAIPGLDTSRFSITKYIDTINANFLEVYISAVYVFLVSASILFAIIMIMIGGLQYAFAGGHGDTAKAKERIKNAVIGLILMLSVYTILYLVNPQLVKIETPGISNIKYIELIDDSGDIRGGITTENLADIDVDCSESGDVSDIATSLVGKVTYRFGAKGDNPPYSNETKTDSDGTAFSSFCPENTICSDCSGFVGIVAECAGLAPVGESGGTAGIFSEADEITNCSGGVVSTQSSSIALNEGDLVGYKPGDREDKPKFGHVWMYIGDGAVISAMGSTPGRQPGGALKIQSLEDICSYYPLRVVTRQQASRSGGSKF